MDRLVSHNSVVVLVCINIELFCKLDLSYLKVLKSEGKKMKVLVILAVLCAVAAIGFW
jgi:hypothetical protein